MSSPLPTIVICLTYVYFVKIWGPQFMKHRPAYNLREVLAVYNAFQIICNGWLFYELGRYGWLSGNYSFICQPVDYSNNEAALRILRASYWFFMSKFLDLGYLTRCSLSFARKIIKSQCFTSSIMDYFL